MDLGLGEGLRPGAPPRDTKTAHIPVILSRQGTQLSRQDSMSDSETENKKPEKKSTSRIMEKIRRLKYGKASNSQRDRSNTNGSYSDTDVNEMTKKRSASLGNGTTGVSVYAEIPLGTSLRQQRELFEKELHQMLGQREVQNTVLTTDGNCCIFISVVSFGFQEVLLQFWNICITSYQTAHVCFESLLIFVLYNYLPPGFSPGGRL